MVDIRPPRFELAAQRCPCTCGGQGELVFYACDRCGQIVLICAEIDTVFPDPKNLDIATALYREDQRCPSCHAEIDSFRPARGGEIQALGFAPGQYS